MNKVCGTVFGLALAMACAAAQGVALSPGPAAVVDLGEVTVGDVRLFTLSFTNVSARSLEVTNIASSCECLQILSYRRAMLPGAINSVRLRLTPDRPGLVTYLVEAAGLAGGAPVWTGEVTARATQGGAVPSSTPDAEGLAPDLLVTVIRDPEARWYVAPGKLLVDGRVRPGVTIVDVRGRGAFDACRIPGSLEISLPLVKTKSFLRSAEVVLLDEGLGSERLERECRRLAGDGFRSVQVLKGGLDRWRRQGGPVTGWQAGKGGLTAISVAEFMEARGSSECLIVYAGGEEESSASLLPPHVTIPFTAGQVGFASEIEECRRRQGGIREVIIVDRDGASREALGAALEGVRDAGVFYLEGGQAAWRDHLGELTRMRGGRTASTRTQVQGVMAPPKPCGQCP